MFDTYVDNILKASTHRKRCKGILSRVQDKSNVLGNWQECLRLDDNKVEFVHVLASKIIKADIENEIVVTDKENASGNTADHSYEYFSICSHEMADTRMLLLALHIDSE